jgi:hypothetical protein
MEASGLNALMILLVGQMLMVDEVPDDPDPPAAFLNSAWAPASTKPITGM